MWQGRNIGPSLPIALSHHTCVSLDLPVFKAIEDKRRGDMSTTRVPLMQAWPRNFPNDTIVSAIRWIRFVVLVVVRGFGQGGRELRTCQLFLCAIACLCNRCVRAESREAGGGAIGLSRWLVG